MKQSLAFYQGEGQAWLDRNKDKLPPQTDPVVEAIAKAGISPLNILEVGCGNGWRLNLLKDKYGCLIQGIDPVVTPEMGMSHGHIFTGSADYLGFRDFSFDLVIYGFCLYLVDRDDLFKVVYEGDRVLKDGGYLVIQDFYPDYPHKVKYKHKDGLFSYKMDHAQLWLANPAYKLRSRIMCAEETSVTILQKNIEQGWPLE